MLGSEGQVTHILVDEHIEAWVRENVHRGRGASFLMSSAARLGEKHGGIAGVQVLELAAPVEHWEHVAAEVQHILDIEGDDRPIVQSRRWTVRTASRRT
jgi:hypothetical protein